MIDTREPEQERTITIATRARRVGSVLISKSNFMSSKPEGVVLQKRRSNIQILRGEVASLREGSTGTIGSYG